MELSKLLTRYYTKELEGVDKTVYDLFKWKKVDVELRNYTTGEVMLDMRGLEFPEHYSQNACDIIVSKYFRKKGVSNEFGKETSLREVVNRMVTFWVDSMLDEELIGEEVKGVVYDELAYMMLAQIWAPNSPQWFNTGLAYYGIKGDKQGHYYYDPKKKAVVESEDSYTRTQGSACFIVGVEDSLVGEKSITDQLKNETLLFKFGSGVGTNWSGIRGKGESLTGGGKSSGLLSFLKVSDANAGAIKSGGTTRRAAKMVVLDEDHPDIEEFIELKEKEEQKVRDLVKMGYTIGLDGEAYATVTGQNANNSVRLSDEFMGRVGVEGAKYKLRGRVDSSVDKELEVNRVWDKINKAAWSCGDPGLQFDDIINGWHTCPSGEDGAHWASHNRINASNPCSEYMFLDDTACNLASINVLKFFNVEKQSFDIEGYLNAIKYIQLVLESTIHWGQFPTEDIARKSYMFRTTGLGLTNMGALLMSMCLPYDSESARVVAASLTTIMTGYSYNISALMAGKVGAFEKYEINKEDMKRVIRNHARVAGYKGLGKGFEGLRYDPYVLDVEELDRLGFRNIHEATQEVWEEAINNGEKYGYRNAQVTVLAPTGTIAFAMDCATTSSEPFYSHVVYKKLVGGGFMQIVNPILSETLRSLGYEDDEIEAIENYVLETDSETGLLKDGKIEGAPYLREEDLEVFDTASKCGTGDRYIKASGHVKMMAALTPCITGAISKTVNMPNEATVEEIAEIYMLSWELGVKAIALYRDGCKATQPMSAINTKEDTNVDLEDLSYVDLLAHTKDLATRRNLIRIKPEGIRNARVHEAVINGLKLYVTVSYDAETKVLSEVYVSCGKQGSLTKGLLDSLSTTISKMLQYGVSPEDIARMYRGQKYEPSGFVQAHPYIKSVESISDLISKVIDIELGNYTYVQVKPEGKVVRIEVDELKVADKVQEVHKKEYTYADYIPAVKCSNCSSEKMVQNGTCKICTVCGTTTGCS